jgi:hypothetical protein
MPVPFLTLLVSDTGREIDLVSSRGNRFSLPCGEGTHYNCKAEAIRKSFETRINGDRRLPRSSQLTKD